MTPPLAGLAIDFPESKLYWISSGNHTINRCNLDGSGLEIIDTMRSQLGKATALAIMGEAICGSQEGIEAGQLDCVGGSNLSRATDPSELVVGLPKSFIPSCHPRRQAVVGRSGVGENGHVQQGRRLRVRGPSEQYHTGDAHESLR